jgi:transcriptional regulator with XRE-family HTH domain
VSAKAKIQDADEPKEMRAIRRALSAKNVDLKSIAERANVSKRTLENLQASRNSPTVSTMMSVYRAIKK